MFQRSHTLLVFAGSILVGSLIGCGGGSGDDDADFAGVWSGNASLVEDGCGFTNADTFIFFTHLVNQAENSVVLDNGFDGFAGTVSGDDGFEVKTDRSIVNPLTGQACPATISWRYDAVEENTASFVVRSTEVRCAGAGICKIAFSGSAFRASDRPIGGPVFAEDNTNEGSIGF
jgi:hypothetical protein